MPLIIGNASTLPMSDASPGASRSITLPAGRIAALRRERLLTQAQLVEACVQRRLYVSIATLKRAEGGRSVSLRTASDLARFFEIPLAQLLGTAVVASPPPSWSETRTMPLLQLAAPPSGNLAARLAQAGAQALDGTGLSLVFDHDAPQRIVHLALEAQVHDAAFGAFLDFIDVVCDAHGVQPSRPALPRVVQGGEVTMGSAMQAALGEALVLEPSGARWRVLGCAPSQLPQAPRLVGRQLEWQRLRAGLESGAQGGVASLMLLRGGIGIGKSRLAGECVSHAQSLGYACHVLPAGLDLGGGDTLLERLVLLLAGSGRAGKPRGWSLEQQALLGKLRGDPLSTMMQGLVAAMSPSRTQYLLGELLGGLLGRHAAAQPQLLVIDNGHEASERFWQTLVDTLAAHAAYPVLVLATLRQGGTQAVDLSGRAAHACVPCLTLDLPPLSQADALMLAEVLGREAHPQLAQCVARAGGNPLFLSCLLAQPVEEGSLPASLRAAVQAELARLASLERYALGIMAVAGDGCPAELLAELGGVREADWPLLATRVGEHWRFASTLVREVLYQQMPTATRLQLHRRLADWYRERDAVACARHLALGGEPRALDELLAAARVEADALRDERALGLLDMARALPANGRQAAALHTLQAELQLRHGKPTLAAMHARLAVEHAADVPAWSARLAGIEALLQLDRIDEALAALAQMERELGAGGDARWLARLYALRGRAYFPRNRIAESALAQQLALAHARDAGDVRLQARAHSGLGDAAYAQGDFTAARNAYRACLALCGADNLLPEQAANRSALGSVLLYLGEVTASLEEALYSLDIARRIGQRRAEVFATLVAGWVLLEMDEPDAARDYLAQGRAVAAAAGLRRFLPLLDEALARAAYELREPGEALSLASAACAEVEAGMLHAYVGPWALATQAALSAAGERPALLAQANTLLADSMYHNRLQFHARLIEASLREGDWATVARQAKVLAATRPDLPWVLSYAALAGVDRVPAEQRHALLSDTARDAAARGYLALARRLRCAA